MRDSCNHWVNSHRTNRQPLFNTALQRTVAQGAEPGLRPEPAPRATAVELGRYTLEF